MIVHEDGRPGDYMYCVACDPCPGIIPVPHETAGTSVLLQPTELRRARKEGRFRRRGRQIQARRDSARQRKATKTRQRKAAQGNVPATNQTFRHARWPMSHSLYSVLDPCSCGRTLTCIYIDVSWLDRQGRIIIATSMCYESGKFVGNDWFCCCG